jgi:hypothetical protein
MNKVKYIITLFILILFSCKGQKRGDLKQNASDSTSKPRMIAYHEDSLVKGSRQQLYLTNVAKFMGLPSITNGSEGLYIRIWIWSHERKYVINISDNFNKNECDITEFNGTKKDDNDFLVIYREWKNLSPQSGWDNFTDTMFQFHIPDMESGEIQNKRKEFLTEMAYVQFEIAQPGKYRFYEYLEPSFYRCVDTGSNNVYQFLNFFNKEMKIRVYNPYPNCL